LFYLLIKKPSCMNGSIYTIDFLLKMWYLGGDYG